MMILIADDSQALESSSVSLDRPGRLYDLIAVNGGSALRYLHVYNAVAVPPNGEKPILTIPVPPGATASLSYAEGKLFSVGICWASSTTLATKTLTEAPDLWVNVQSY